MGIGQGYVFYLVCDGIVACVGRLPAQSYGVVAAGCLEIAYNGASRLCRHSHRHTYHDGQDCSFKILFHIL